MSKKMFKDHDRVTVTCDACGKRIDLDIRKHYVARDNDKTGMSTIASHEEPTLYDAVDCPRCGRQKLLGIRLRRYLEPVKLEEEEWVDE